MRTTIRRLGRFFRLSGRDRFLVLRAAGTLWAYRIRLWLRPFRVPPEVGSPVKGAKGTPEPSPAAGEPAPDRIAWAVRAASHAVPRSTCLVQALAAQRLLARTGHHSRLHLGAARAEDTGAFEAHAWLEVEGEVLLGGGERLGRYSPFTRGRDVGQEGV